MLINKFLKLFNLKYIVRKRTIFLIDNLKKRIELKKKMLIYDYNKKKEKILYESEWILGE